MNESTQLRQIALVGPAPAIASSDSAHPIWQVDLAVAYQGRDRVDKSLANSTLGLRVLQQDAEATPIELRSGKLKAQVQFHVPRLLTANVQPRSRGSLLRLADSAEPYTVLAVSAGTMATAAVVPVGPWPSPQTTLEAEVPPFRLVEHRVRVLVQVPSAQISKPYGFLRMAPLPGADHDVAIFVGDADSGPYVTLKSIPWPDVGVAKTASCVALELTPQGIEFEGRLQDPSQALTDGQRQSMFVRLRLVQRADPVKPGKATWSVELLEGTGTPALASIRRMLDAIRQAFLPNGQKPIFIDLDAAAPLPAVRWPLEEVQGGVGLPSGCDWRIWVDARAVFAQLVGRPVRGGELPTGVELPNSHLQLEGAGKSVSVNLAVNRRPAMPGALSAPVSTGRPDLRLVWRQNDQRELKLTPEKGQQQVRWYLDEVALARSLRARYAKAGVHPPNATHTYAFLALKKGWLQMPLAVPPAQGERQDEKGEPGAVPFSSPLVSTVPNGSASAEGELVVQGADEVLAFGRLDGGQLLHIEVELKACTGSMEGLLWLATASPSAVDALPGLEAGPAALASPAMQFGVVVNAGQRRYEFSAADYRSGGQGAEISILDSAPARSPVFLWHSLSELPLITAMPLTQVSASAGIPSSHRGLLCWQLTGEGPLSLSTTSALELPSLGVGANALDLLPELKEVPLALVTLPGIDFLASSKPTLAIRDWDVRLRHSLPVLDEYFANVRTPQPDAPSDTGGAPPAVDKKPAGSGQAVPTSLDMSSLRRAWQQALDRYRLSRLQSDELVPAGDWCREKVKVASLAEDVTWSAAFTFSSTTDMGGSALPFGAYTLGDQSFSGEGALTGLSDTLTTDDGQLLMVTGHAVPSRRVDGKGGLSWIDSRGLRMAAQAIVETVGPVGAGTQMSVRKASLGGKDRWLCTLAKPLPIKVPLLQGSRNLGLWFRDLAMEVSQDGGVLRLSDEARESELALGPQQEAFNRDRLPFSHHEWRLCNDPLAMGSSPSLWTLDLGMFRFQALRLAEIELTKAAGAENWKPAKLQLIGSLSLAVSGLTADPLHPFGPEWSDSAANLVCLDLVENNGQLSLGGATWRDVNVSESAKVACSSPSLNFYWPSVPVKCGNSSAGETPLRLTLHLNGLSDANGLPRLESISLDTVLFGQRVAYDNISPPITDADGISLSVWAPQEQTHEQGLILCSIHLTWAAGSTPELSLNGAVSIQRSAVYVDMMEPPDPLAVVRYELGGALNWLNASLAAEGTELKVDHRTGWLAVVHAIQAQGPSLRLEPVAGLAIAQPRGEARLVVAFSTEDDAKAPVGPWTWGLRVGQGYLRLRGHEGGPVTRLDHELTKPVSGEGQWQSDLTLDLCEMGQCSRISWPVRAVQGIGGQSPDAFNAADVSGRATPGHFKPDTCPLTHTVSWRAKGVTLPLGRLGIKNQKVVIAFPWAIQAWVQHEVTVIPRQPLTWTSLDQLQLIDGWALRSLAAASLKVEALLRMKGGVINGRFAFAARYRNTMVQRPTPKLLKALKALIARVQSWTTLSDDAWNQALSEVVAAAGQDLPDDVVAAIKAGVVLRAFAQAGFPTEHLARQLKLELEQQDDKGLGVVVASGAGAALFSEASRLPAPDRAPHGVLLALPWLVHVGVANHIEFPQQVPVPTYWVAPDIDWAAGCTAPLALGPVSEVIPSQGADAEIMAMLSDLSRGAEALGPQMAVEQHFLRWSGNAAPPPITQWPLWLRSLLALRAVWTMRRETDQIQPVLLVPVGGGAVRCRVAVLPSQSPPPVAVQVRLFALSRDAMGSQVLPASSIAEIAALGWKFRLSEQAQRLVKQPVLAWVTQVPLRGDGQVYGMWVELSSDLDDSAWDALQPDATPQLFGAPSLGWPTKQGTDTGFSGVLAQGCDAPFQDVVSPASLGSATPPDDVKRYGSGLSGRSVSLAAPARASAIDAAPTYIALGRKTAFDRPATGQLPVRSAPARHLSATEARAVIPTSAMVDQALAQVVQTRQLAPLLPPYMERSSVGARAGALEIETEILISGDEAWKKQAMDRRHPEYGQPGHAGPRLLRQHRVPRSPALPRVPAEFVRTHGRRTFVEVDRLEQSAPTMPRPFELLDGVGSVLRRGGKSVVVMLKEGAGALLAVGPDWGGGLTLEFSSEDHLASSVREVLQGPAETRTPFKLAASLSIGGQVFTLESPDITDFTQEPVKVPLTLPAIDLPRARGSLSDISGDSAVILEVRNASASSGPLVEVPNARISMRLPVLPAWGPVLSVRPKTLVFADPAYDRELAGPASLKLVRSTVDDSLWQLTLDRFEYAPDTPIYLAAGLIDAETRLFKAAADRKLKIAVARLPKSSGGQQLLEKQILGGPIEVKSGQVYVTSLHELSALESTVQWQAGDTLEFTLFSEGGVNISIPVLIVDFAVVSPPSSVYCLVVSKGKSDGAHARADVALHATSPMPRGVELAHAAEDMAKGHVRRRAIFSWTYQNIAYEEVDLPSYCRLLKFDRAGGGQLF